MPRILLSSVFAIPPIFSKNCEIAAAAGNPPGPAIFAPEQDGLLGDIAAETMSRSLPADRQPGLAGPVDRMAARLTPLSPLLRETLPLSAFTGNFRDLFGAARLQSMHPAGD